MDIEISFSGPLFTGQCASVMDDIMEDAQYAVGNAALEGVHRYLNAQIKHPTPYYETQIIQQRRGDAEIVHDRGIVYGPWLEGTSARNNRSTFKGYASFRKARDEVFAKVPSIVSQVIARNIGRLS